MERKDKNSFVIEIAPGHRWIVDTMENQRFEVNQCLDWSRVETSWLNGVVLIGRVGRM